MSFRVSDEAEKLEQDAKAVRPLVELLEVRVFSLNARIIDLEACQDLQPIKEFSLRLGVGRTEDALSFKFEYQVTVKGAGEADAIEFAVEIGVLFELSDEDYTREGVTEDAIGAFGQTTAQLVAFPYLRSAISDLSSRLGCGPVTLGLIGW